MILLDKEDIMPSDAERGAHHLPGEAGSPPIKPAADSGGWPADHDAPQSSGYEDLSELVEQIRAGDQEAMERLYRMFARGIRFYLFRQLGIQDLDDRVHDVFLIVVQAIRRGELREPERLMGFVRTVVRRQVATHIERIMQSRRRNVDADSSLLLIDSRQNPEKDLLDDQKVQLMREALRSLSARDREILTRFYLREESQEQICREMGLTETQFRLLKSRAKARFGELGQRQLRNRLKFLVRKSGA
jgi:RNA polymerase sigma factor (sigma-70 family)